MARLKCIGKGTGLTIGKEYKALYTSSTLYSVINDDNHMVSYGKGLFEVVPVGKVMRLKEDGLTDLTCGKNYNVEPSHMPNRFKVLDDKGKEWHIQYEYFEPPRRQVNQSPSDINYRDNPFSIGFDRVNYNDEIGKEFRKKVLESLSKFPLDEADRLIQSRSNGTYSQISDDAKSIIETLGSDDKFTYFYTQIANKLARMKHGYSVEDSLLDIAGYAKLELEKLRNEEKTESNQG